MLRCPYCNHELEEYIHHEGARDEQATVKFECLACGPVQEKEESCCQKKTAAQK